MRTPTDQAAQQDPSAERKRKQKEQTAKQYQARRAAAARVVELEELAEWGPLTEQQAAEVAELEPKAQQKQKKKESTAKYRRVRKAEAARVAEPRGRPQAADRGHVTATALRLLDDTGLDALTMRKLGDGGRRPGGHAVRLLSDKAGAADRDGRGDAGWLS
ncbi:hypothetical protein [Saccharopolyspora spinosa]|uniref:hypothetical protein n=1 Tax=Saccharopolyspora spinosa TaxID=60894 RepID=UPI0019312A7C|nr:hypothetical protein [Saccharopolyspora spinosa]